MRLLSHEGGPDTRLWRQACPHQWRAKQYGVATDLKPHQWVALVMLVRGRCQYCRALVGTY
jgi:hypothetical protein